MPFHHHSPSSSQQNPPSNHPGAASAIFQATQALGSVGAPAGSLRVATSGAGMTNPDDYLPSPGGGSGLPVNSSGGQTAPPATSGLPHPQSANPSAAPGSATTGQMQQFQTPRRTQTFGRQPEELHLPTSPISQPGSNTQSLDAQQYYFQNNPEGQSGHVQHGQLAPNINVQQSTPSSAQYASSPGGLPGSLQPGNPTRPGPLSSNTAPSTVPTMPQLSHQQQSSQQQQQQQQTPSRTSTLNHTHSYSRSSPSGFEGQKYVPFSNTPENSKFASPPNSKYTPIQGIGTSQSPLGLADIRPRADSGMSDSPYGANPYSYDGMTAAPTNSNYLAPWAIYAFDWCKWPVQQQGSAGKIAVGSYLEDGHNFIQILDTHVVPEQSAPGGPSYSMDFSKLAEATHPYPVTRILWEPPSSQKQTTDLLATSGDHLRLWSLPPNASASSASNSITRTSNSHNPAPHKLTPLALLSNSKSPEHTAPLTSLDWNTLSPSLIITSSIDTTCTIWDIPTLTAKTQLIAHDKEVFDVRFCANSVDVFVSCGADGSVRMFDLRSLEHSTIIYEPSEKGDKESGSGKMSPTTAQQTMTYSPPLLRLAASPHDAHLLATFSQDSNIIRILDVRQPGQALLELQGHSASVNCIEWSPSRRGTLATGGDDSLVLLWDLLNQGNAAATPTASINGVPHGQAGTTNDHGRAPAASWRCEYEVGNLSWAPQSALTSQGDWLGVSGGRGVWGVKL
ncbi:MAG: hypothetical protein M1824_005683 [Vezdaea acicularis]|nr:MAG: hypothetical protein M1824_005683 [Vezdaea acicularis]